MKRVSKLSSFMALQALLGLTACVGTPAAYEPQAVRPAPPHHGYLSREQLQSLAADIPAPPAAGSTEEAADRALSDTYRVLENTDRWLLATSHAEVRMPFALQHFDCTLGVVFNPANNSTPATARLMHRLFEDAEASSTLVKLRAYRARPIADDRERAACQRFPEAGRASPSYPSGSAAVAGVYGEAMAAIAPEHADGARRIGQQIAISRVVCAMHYPQDAKIGYQMGQATFALAAQTPEFQADLALAREEYAALKAKAETNPGCAAERHALSMTQDIRL